jgi:hypothetical protein
MPRALGALLALLVVAGCAGGAGGAATSTFSPRIAASAIDPCCFAEALAIAERHRHPGIDTRRFSPNLYWGLLSGPLASPRLRTEQIGASVHGRPLVAVHVGTGPVTVLAWSQMHGDESAASMGLLDLLTWLADDAPDALRDRLLASVTLTLVPMLNPDGAELFQRHNALGVDINRDARRLSTPEARALKGLHERLQPQFGFNLHDQGARQTAGRGGKQAGIALLAPAISEDRRYDDVRARARLVAARIATNLGTVIPGQVARYDDTFNPRAFGDLMGVWGTSTVLIESGALAGDPEKQRLRTLNAAAFLDAVLAIGEGRWAEADGAVYDALGQNSGVSFDVLVRNAQVVGLGPEPYLLDVGLQFGDAVSKEQPRVTEVGDLSVATALDTVDATGLYLHPAPSMLTAQEGRRWLRIGTPATFTLRRGPDPSSAVVITVDSTGRRD